MYSGSWYRIQNSTEEALLIYKVECVIKRLVMRVHPPLNSDLMIIYNSNSIAEQFTFKEFMRLRGVFRRSSRNPIWMYTLMSKILAQSFITVSTEFHNYAPSLKHVALLSSKWAILFNHTICSSIQGTQVKDTGRYLYADSMPFFLKRGQIFTRDHSFRTSP